MLGAGTGLLPVPMCVDAVSVALGPAVDMAGGTVACGVLAIPVPGPEASPSPWATFLRGAAVPVSVLASVILGQQSVEPLDTYISRPSDAAIEAGYWVLLRYLSR